MTTIHRYKVVDSTNLEVRRLWEDSDGAPSPMAVVAEEQSAGLGRAGRNWASPPGGLWMSVAWPASLPFSHYKSASLAVGLAVAEVLEDGYGLAARIKWPNDIMVGERKLAGILCQACSPNGRPCLITGIGLNGNYPTETLDGSLLSPATTLQGELGHAVDLQDLESSLLKHLVGRLSGLERSGLETIVNRIRERLTWVGETVYSTGAEGQEEVAGVLEGIDDEGRMLLRIGQETRPFVCGEIARLRRQDRRHEVNQAT